MDLLGFTRIRRPVNINVNALDEMIWNVNPSNENLFFSEEMPNSDLMENAITFAEQFQRESEWHNAHVQQVTPFSYFRIFRHGPTNENTEPELVQKANDDEIEDEDIEQWQKTIAEIDSKSIPECFICPIQMEIMKNPCVAMDGHTYERSAILRWFKAGDSCKSPLTNEVMAKKIVPNFALKKMISEWVTKAVQTADSEK